MQTATKLPAPNSAISEVLRALIVRPAVKERDHEINSFRDIIHELKTFYHIPIRHTDIPAKTKHGRPVKYRQHFLLSISRKKAIRTYLKINAA